MAHTHELPPKTRWRENTILGQGHGHESLSQSLPRELTAPRRLVKSLYAPGGGGGGEGGAEGGGGVRVTAKNVKWGDGGGGGGGGGPPPPPPPPRPPT
mmetsp:Transcript_10236/g.14699  ORF Transcript_10236/g.14699 Transcript_10236/m.14699 type:complete len:98 (+) Transcript_10236:681-974(+)